MENKDQQFCKICGYYDKAHQTLKCSDIREGLFTHIQKDHPHYTKDSHICYSHLNQYRLNYIEEQLRDEDKEVNKLAKEVLESIQKHEIIANELLIENKEDYTFGERLADKIASFGGSWRFIITFGVILFVWISLNSVSFFFKVFDPYPFILLNLVLSCLAALQAPVIMMSQNRKEVRDRQRAESDYKINLKAEIEVKNLHDKMDYLMMQQWKRLMEVQQIQIELMETMMNKMENDKTDNKR